MANGLDALVGCPELEHISLSGNPIKELTTLEPLVSGVKCRLSLLSSCCISTGHCGIEGSTCCNKNVTEYSPRGKLTGR